MESLALSSNEGRTIPDGLMPWVLRAGAWGRQWRRVVMESHRNHAQQGGTRGRVRALEHAHTCKEIVQRQTRLRPSPYNKRDAGIAKGNTLSVVRALSHGRAWRRTRGADELPALRRVSSCDLEVGPGRDVLEMILVSVKGRPYPVAPNAVGVEDHGHNPLLP